MIPFPRATGLALALLASTVLFSACQDLVEPRSDPPVLTGVVLSVDEDHAIRDAVYELGDLEYHFDDPLAPDRVDPETGEPWGRAFVYLVPGGRCFSDRSTGLQDVGCGQIQVGDRLQAWGIPRLPLHNFSAPPHYGTDQIVILRK